MDLWIRSQDKTTLELVKRVEIEHKLEFDRKDIMIGRPVETKECYVLVNGKNFGEYKTEKRAIEVLDEIQNNMYVVWEITQPTGDVYISKDPRKDNFIVYEMPADDEVEA